MKRSTISTTLAAGALALSLALVGCGGSNSTTTETTETTEETTEQTAEENPTYPEETTTEEQVQNAEGEQNAPEEQVEVKEEDKNAEITVSDEDAAKIAELEETKKGNPYLYTNWGDWYEYYYNDMRGWSVAFKGSTDTGMDLWYAGDSAGTKAALFVVDRSSSAYWSYVGDVVNLGNGNYAIVDDYSGRSFYFHTNGSDYGGNVYISLGGYDRYGYYGSGVFSPCSVYEVLDAMDMIETYGYSLNYY